MSFEEDPLDELARLLRTGAGSDMRAEAEIAEIETHQGRLRRRTLADVAWTTAERGDRIRLALAGGEMVGVLTHVGVDYLSVETTSQRLDVRLESVAWSIERRPAGGIPKTKGSVTFKARLAEYEQTGEPLTLVVGKTELQGSIAVAATDHVVLITEGTETVIPLTLIDRVVRPISD